MPNPTPLTSPVKTTGMPSGVPFIIWNEAAERFCFYGMKAVLVVFMTKFLVGAGGKPDAMTEPQAREWYHVFLTAVYFLPFFGAILSDVFWGKYRTIFWLSLVYCAGNLALSADSTRIGLATGLALIAIGSGGIKPCVSANVGDQFGQANQHLLPKAFGWFYFSVNFGSFFSTLLTPWLLEKYGAKAAFGVPSIFMFLATVVFWCGRNRMVRIPPSGSQFVREVFSKDGVRTIASVIPLFTMVAMFWSLWDQTGSAWVLQAEKMNLRWLGIDWLPSQIQAANPLLVLILIPVMSYAVYPMMDKVIKMTPLRKIGIGMFLTVPTFIIPALLEALIDGGSRPSIGWQFLDYAIISVAEIMVSITCLEFAYTQAPKKLKSLIMSLYYMSIALGNAFTAVFNHFIQNPDGTSKLTGAHYYWFFAGMMLLTSFIFVAFAVFYKEKTHIQDEASS